MAKSRSLTIILLKGEVTEPADFIRPERLGEMNTPFPLVLRDATPAWLFVRKTHAQPPRWASFFRDHISANDLGSVSTVAAVLLIHIREFWFALTFGQGRYLLLSDRIVDEFGLRTTLNAVEEGSLRSIDKETFDAIASHSRLQANQGTDTSEFGLDVERDLLRAVTGTPSNQALGERLSGMDALAVSSQTALDAVPELLAGLLQMYQEDTYLSKFPWVENIRAVREPDLLADLDAALFNAILAKDFNNTWLAPPQVLDWADVRYFGYSDSDSAHVFTDIHWRTLLRNMKGPLSRETLKRKRVYCFGEDGNILRDWPAFNCIYAEIPIGKDYYLLTTGQWYKVFPEFVDEVEEWFKDFPRRKSDLPIYDHDSEEQYNEHVAATSKGHYALLDQRTIVYGGGRSRIEFCDLLGIDGEIVHVKRYSGSRDLSHLFAQGFVSGELLRIDQSFRDALRSVVPQQHWKTCRLGGERVPGRQVTFAIIYRSEGPFFLPFFSKISLRQAARRLTGYEYSVTLARVNMNQIRARLEKKKSDVL